MLGGIDAGLTFSRSHQTRLVLMCVVLNSMYNSSSSHTTVAGGILTEFVKMSAVSIFRCRGPFTIHLNKSWISNLAQ